MPLQMQSALSGRTARLTLAGELDSNSAPPVREEVERLLQSAPSRLVLLVEELNFMSSAGLRIIIFAKQRQPALKIYLVRPQETVVDTLRKTGFYDGVYVVEEEVPDEAAAG